MLVSVKILDELANPIDNGIVVFVSGFLFILSVYHFFLYFQHKDKSYLYYSLYAFLVFIYTYHRDENFILTKHSESFLPFLKLFYDPIKWLYSIIYLYFAISFIELERYNPKWNKIVIKYANYALVILIFSTLLSILMKNFKIVEYLYNFVFLPSILMLSVYLLYVFWETESPVKKYLVIGSGTFLVLSGFSHLLTYTGHPFRVIFYFVITFEIILFALGLGKKQKIILEEKNKWQAMIIDQHEENLKIKDLLAQKLDKEVAEKTQMIIELLKENEAEKRKKMALKYSKQILKLRMHALQSQMNPHFLFNSLNSIKHFIIHNNQKDAIVYLTKFAKFIRKVLDFSYVGEVSIKEELDMMKLYLEIENYRFNKELIYIFSIDDNLDLYTIKVPPMILQAFLENSIWHGLAMKKNEKKITVEVKKMKDYIYIIITDNGIGRDKAQKIKLNKSALLNEESMGIKITKERLRVFTQNRKLNSEIIITDLTNDQNKPIGTRVTIKIPLK